MTSDAVPDTREPFDPTDVTWTPVSSRLIGARLTVTAIVLGPLLVLLVLVAVLVGRGVALGVPGGRACCSSGGSSGSCRDRCVRWRTRSAPTTCSCGSGIMFRSLVVVPYGRMQYVDVNAGPLARKFGIATVQLHTASPATSASIDGLAAARGRAPARPDGLARRGAAGGAVTEHVPGTPSTHRRADVERQPATSDVTGWRRMHPVTPALKGWTVLVAVLAIGWFQVGENIERGASTSCTGGRWLAARSAAILLIGLIGFGYSAVAWRVTRFAVTDEAVHLRTGILFRQQRQARLDRLQAVDVVQPLLARLVGLAELKLEVAGGGGSGRLARRSCARRTRRRCAPSCSRSRRGCSGRAPWRSRRAGRAADEPGVAPVAAWARLPRASSPFEVAPERQVYELPMGRLVSATLRSGAVPVMLLVVAGAITLAIVSRDISAVFVLLAPLFAGVTFVWSRINQGANFRAAISPDGIRLRHGLTETRAQTVPPGRVQAIRLRAGSAVARAGLVARRDQRRRLRPGRRAAAGHRAAPGRPRATRR